MSINNRVPRNVGSFLPILAMSCALLTTEATAQGDSDTSFLLEEILVVARKRDENVQEVPIPITALSDLALEARGIDDIKGIEDVVPNLSYRSSGVRSTSSVVFLRGIGQLNFTPEQDPKVGVYVDEVYIARPQGSLFNLLDIEQVEVLRGPQGTLFGRNTTAGLVHVRTRQPGPEFGGKVKLGVGNDGQIAGDLVLNLPIVEDKLAARVALQTREDDGYMKDRSGRDWNTNDAQTFRGTLLWTPTDTLDVTLSGEYYRARQTASLANCSLEDSFPPEFFLFVTDIFGGLDELQQACADDGDVYTSNDNDPNGVEIDNYAGSLKIDWDLGGYSITSISSYREVDELNESWGYGTDFVGGPSFHVESNAVDPNPYEQWSQELRIQSSSDNFQWVAGLYAFGENGKQVTEVRGWRGLGAPADPADAPLFGLPSPFPGFATLGDFALFVQGLTDRVADLRASNDSFAVFGEGTYDVTDKLSITAGYRWTRDEREVELRNFLLDGTQNPFSTCQGQPVPAGGFCGDEKEFTESTWRLIVDYNLTEDILLYGSVSRGYSSGGINLTGNLTPFLPENSDNYELGIKSQLFDDRLRLNAGVFYNSYENQQVLQAVVVQGSPEVEVLNAQESTIQGIELEVQADLGAGFYTSLTAGYIDSEFDKFTFNNSNLDPVTGELILTEVDATGLESLRESPLTYSINITKDHQFDGGSSLNATVGWAWRDRIYNTLDRREQSKQEAYGLLNARIDWRLPNGNTSIAIWGTNLNDKEYFRFASDTGPTFGVTARYFAEPRRFGISVTHQFGG